MKETKVYIHEQLPVTIANFRGHLNLEEFQEVALGSLELRTSLSSNVQVALIEDMKVLSADIQNWIQTVWFPQAINGGLKHLGFVVPKSAIATMSMKSANKEAEQDSPVDIQYFSNENEALAWVRSLPK